MDLEEYEHELTARTAKRSSRPHSFDSSSVKEVDPGARFQQVRNGGDQMHSEGTGTVAQLQTGQLAREDYQEHRETPEPQDGSDFEDLLKAGRDELLMTSTLSLRHLSNEKIVSLMQLIMESGSDSSGSSPQMPPKLLAHSQGTCSPLLPNLSLSNPSAGLRLFNRLLARVKALVSFHLVATPRSRLLNVIYMSGSESKAGRGDATQMSEAVAGVLEGGYLSDLQHLSLPPCNIATIVRALIYGGVSKLRHLELQNHLDSWQYSKGRLLRRLFMSGLLDQLQHLRLSRCVEAEEMEALASAFDNGRMPMLTHLDLSFNLFQGDSASKWLGKVMRCRALDSVEHLHLDNCGISDAEMQALASAITERGRWQLRYLNLGSNEIGDDGFAALLTVLKADRLPQLQELHFLYNYRIGEESKVEVANILEDGHVPRLKIFYLSSHSITDRVADAFLAAFKNNTALTVELIGIWWPNERIERETAGYRERNLGLLASVRKTLDFGFMR